MHEPAVFPNKHVLRLHITEAQCVSLSLSLSRERERESVTENEWWLRLADCVRCRFDVVFWRPESSVLQLYIQLKMCAASMCHIYFHKLVKGFHSFRAFQSPLVLDFMEVNVAA